MNSEWLVVGRLSLCYDENSLIALLRGIIDWDYCL